MEDGDSVTPTVVGVDGDSSPSNKGGASAGNVKSAKGKPFPKRPMCCKISAKCWPKLEELFRKMDPDGSNAVDREEAKAFFKGKFGKISADAMFNEVDQDASGAIDAEEFVSFWISVRRNGYKEQDILDELDMLLEGGAWVDWKDGRDVTANLAATKHWPNRPLLSSLSQETWDKCIVLFETIDNDKTHSLNKEKAAKHFKGKLGKISVDAMFNEIDINHHGQITCKEWMKFWVNVKSSGYKQQDMLDELDNLVAGEQWVDWKDGRSTA